MKIVKLFITASMLSALLCPAQDKDLPAKPDVVVAAAPSTAVDSYVIGASDVLNVTVWKEPTLTSSLLVRPDGKISMPLLGDVQAVGLTPLQLADEVTAELQKFIQDPKVSVVLTQINSKKIFLMGEVAHPGPVEITPGMTLLQAIASVGGLTNFANQKKIYILRNEAAKSQKIEVHYKEALKGNSAFNLVLKTGDTIVVP